MAIKILVDSASDISKIEADKLGITMIPMEINFGEEQFLDGVELLPSEFYEKLTTSPTLPKTSQINEFRFNEAFYEMTKNGDEVLAIVISSKLSGTVNNAINAAKNYNGKVKVVDSLNACIGERLLVYYALNLIKEGKNLEEVYSLVNENKSKLCVMAVIDTLEYLKKGGRISSTTAFAGKLLSIKPIIAVIDGEVKVIGKAKGGKNSRALLTSIVNTVGGINLSMPYGTLFSGVDQTNLNAYLQESSCLWQENTQIDKFILGATIGTHVGPGAVGLAFFKN